MIQPESVQAIPVSPEYAQRRFGRFKITDEVIKYQFDDLKRLFGEIIVTRCEHNVMGYFDYSGLSMLFDPVPDSIETPEYRIEVTRRDDGSLSFAAKKL